MVEDTSVAQAHVLISSLYEHIDATSKRSRKQNVSSSVPHTDQRARTNVNGCVRCGRNYTRHTASSRICISGSRRYASADHKSRYNSSHEGICSTISDQDRAYSLMMSSLASSSRPIAAPLS